MHASAINKILLVRPDGIGDQILCLPVAAALRRLLPEARIAFLSSAYAAPVFDHHPDVDEVVAITGHEPLRELADLFRHGFDAAIFLKPFRRLMIAAWLARVPLRVATGYRWYSVFANRRVYQHRSDFSKHETDYNVALLAGLGLDGGSPVRPSLALTHEERQSSTRRTAAVPAPRIVLHPGGFAARRWKAEHYWNLAQRLIDAGFGVVLTGTAAERERFCAERRTLDVLPNTPGLLDLMGQLSVRELMGVIGVSHAVVSGATGPAHVAAALGVPTVSLFDPRRNNLPTRWRPLGTGVVLRPDVPTCEKCIYEACPYWDCLDRIDSHLVLRHLQDIVSMQEPLRVLHV
ncbi:MAG: glycosyltransferase family 9 protein [Nitrospirota bacterium]|nr:glycosyltransferase family 9 protein [Nitrospirota bacterium]